MEKEDKQVVTELRKSSLFQANIETFDAEGYIELSGRVTLYENRKLREYGYEFAMESDDRLIFERE